MPPEQGRLEKRTRLAVPVQIVWIGSQRAERATTENVCSQGVRVFVREPLQQSARLLLTSPAGDQRKQVRVIYCERLPNGLFAAGLQFQGKPIDWSHASLEVARDDAMDADDSN